MLKKLISSILIFIIATSSIFIVYVAVCVDDKSVFGYRIFSVISGSMSPTIEKGDLLLTKKPQQAELEVGTIITFISNDPDIKGKFNTHRIVRIDGNIYYTGGDASNYTDKETVRFGDIVGRVIWHSSFLGSIITWASKPINMLCFIILPVGLITFFDVGKGYSLIKKFFSKERGRKFIKKKVPKTIIKKRRGRENKKRLILNT